MIRQFRLTRPYIVAPFTDYKECQQVTVLEAGAVVTLVDKELSTITGVSSFYYHHIVIELPNSVLEEVKTPDVPHDLKLQALARENAILKAELETARKFDRKYYKRRVQHLRKRLYELHAKNPKTKWAIRIKENNADMLSKYMENIYPVKDRPRLMKDVLGLFFLSGREYEFLTNYLPDGYVLIKNKYLKKIICAKEE